MYSIVLFTVFCGIILLIAIIQEVLRQVGKEKWANLFHYAVLFLGLIFFSKFFLQLVYTAEEMLKR